MQKTRRCDRHSERGAALIFVLVSLMVLTMIGIGFTFQAITDYRISENFVSRQEALAIAEAGMAITRQQIQRGDFSTLLAQQGTVPAYIAVDVPEAGSFASRNAISTRAARNVNAETLYAALAGNQSDNVIGATGIHSDNQPSVDDITNTLRISSDPDQAKLLNPNFVGNLIGKIRNFADNYYSSSQSFSGGGVSLGTVAAPKITYIDGDLSLTGGGSGAGLLIVKGEFEFGGSFTWDGLIFVVGEGKLRIHGANQGIIGGVYVQNLTETSPGQFVSGPADIEFDGNSNFYYSGDMIRMGLGLLPLQMLEWREISTESP